MSSEREAQRVAFLAQAGLAAARREPLAADASTRRYERLYPAGAASLMLMDSPPANDGDPLGAGATPAERIASGYTAMARLSASRIDAFAAAAGFLVSRGLSAPKVLAMDAAQGFALLEDLGDGLFARLIEAGEPEEPLYLTAVEALAQLHSQPPPRELVAEGARWPLLTYDSLALKTGADLFVDWLPQLQPSVVLNDQAVAAWDDLWRPIRERAERGASAFAHRDYHAENLLWLPERSGVARVGMIDFQDCVLAHPSWDLHSLLQDARRDVSPALEAAALAHYFGLRPEVDRDAFMEDYTALAALNEARIIGIFARLIVRDGKPRYRAFLPRMWRHLETNLAHPALAGLRAWFETHVPKEARS